MENVPSRLASAKQRPPAASTTAPAATARLSPSRRAERRTPARRHGIERQQRGVVERLDALVGGDGAAQRGGDGVARAIADLQQPLARRTATAREAVAAVAVVREGDAEALQALDRGGRLGGERCDEAGVGRLVRAVHDVLGVHRGRVVVAECRLDAALRLGRVGRREPELGREQHSRARLGQPRARQSARRRRSRSRGHRSSARARRQASTVARDADARLPERRPEMLCRCRSPHPMNPTGPLARIQGDAFARTRLRPRVARPARARQPDLGAAARPGVARRRPARGHRAHRRQRDRDRGADARAPSPPRPVRPWRGSPRPRPPRSPRRSRAPVPTWCSTPRSAATSS